MTQSSTAKAWDERFSQVDWMYGREPNRFLASLKNRLPSSGTALAVGDGEGRNGVWLARQGLDVTAIDASAVGLAKGEGLAVEHGVQALYHTVEEDLQEWDWPREHYDLVAAIFIHYPSAMRKAMHDRYVAALKPGGLLVMECFEKRQLENGTGGPRDLDLLYDLNELKLDFTALELEMADDLDQDLHEGEFHKGQSALIRIVGRKRA